MPLEIDPAATLESAVPAAAPAPAASEAPAVAEASEPRTFTQDELEQHLGRRVAREQAKFDRQLREEREQRIRLEERLNAAQPKAAVQGEKGPPKLADFGDFDEYVQAKAEYVAEQHINKRLSENQKTQEQAHSQHQERQTVEAWEKKVAAVAKDMPDYREVVSENTYPLTNSMKSFIMESDQGPQLAYYLARHLDEANQIAQLTPSGAARKLTLIEAGFKTNPVSRTPQPLNINGARQTSGVKSLSDISSTEEFMKRRRDFIAKKR